MYVASLHISKFQSILTKVVIDIHGGGFVLGHSGMVNKDQISDCLQRGWMVLSPNHRLCPQVDLLQGPMQDCRDLLKWIYDGGLQTALTDKLGTDAPLCDLQKVMAFGTSAGGHLALAMGWAVEKKPRAILDLYAPVGFGEPQLNKPLEAMKARVPAFDEDFLNKIYEESPIPTTSGVSLEGHVVARGPDFSNPRDAFTFHNLANGTLLHKIWPSKQLEKVDPLLNIGSDFPPTCIVHGQADTMVDIELSRMLYEEMKKKGVEVEMIEIPGAEHTFAGMMEKGGEIWEFQKKGFDFLERVIAR